MKTTIDLPDELVREAKRAAIARGTTLRSLVLRGLQREIQTPSGDSVCPIRSLLDLDADVWRGIAADRYVETLRSGWA